MRAGITTNNAAQASQLINTFHFVPFWHTWLGYNMHHSFVETASKLGFEGHINCLFY
jgi:hypothetical protein